MAKEKSAMAPRGQRAQGLSPQAEYWPEPRIPDRHTTNPENRRAKLAPRPWQDMRRGWESTNLRNGLRLTELFQTHEKVQARWEFDLSKWREEVTRLPFSLTLAFSLRRGRQKTWGGNSPREAVQPCKDNGQLASGPRESIGLKHLLMG